MWLLLYPDNSTKEVTTIDELPKDVTGFVYLIVYKDGTKYIGKKNLYSTVKIKSLASGKQRPNVIGKEYRNTGKGFRQSYDIVRKETDWLKYKGSHKERLKPIDKKYILDFAYTKLQLTYLEAKLLFKHEVLESNEFLNENILNTFYKDRLHEY